MSDMAKQARAAMKAKAKSLTSADPHQKVDSSTWSPPEALNTTAKTGMRPISRRAFKAGGKVEGEKAKCNMGRAPRKSGGSTEAKEWMNAKINRNVKDANEEREGIKHVGGMKKGGRTKKTFGGVLGGPMGGLIPMAVNAMRGKDDEKKRGGRTEKQGGGGMSSGRGILTKDGKDVVGPTSMPATEEKKAPPIPQRPQREPEKGMSGQEASEFMKARKSGGRAKKAGGGDLEMYGKGVSGAAEMMKKASARAGVPGGLYGAGFQRVGAGKLSPMGATGMTRLKKGGKAESHPDEKMDIALIKKMVKPSARTGKDLGGPAKGYAGTRQKAGEDYLPLKDMIEQEVLKKQDSDPNANRGQGPTAQAAYRLRQMKYLRPETSPLDALKGRKTGGRTKRKEGGGVFSGPSYPGKIPGVVPGGREARATGGKTRGKGKTNINIVIAAGKPADQGMMGGMPGGPTKPPGMDGGPGGVPVPVPPPQMGGMPGGMPMPMPMPMPAAGGAPAGGPPTPRKDGGRLTKVASSYKDMEAGAGGGEGRLQKTDIAKKHKDAPAFRRGGKAYRSYKDMDAGAGSGMGRLEKTEIQARKG